MHQNYQRRLLRRPLLKSQLSQLVRAAPFSASLAHLDLVVCFADCVQLGNTSPKATVPNVCGAQTLHQMPITLELVQLVHVVIGHATLGTQATIVFHRLSNCSMLAAENLGLPLC